MASASSSPEFPPKGDAKSNNGNPLEFGSWQNNHSSHLEVLSFSALLKAFRHYRNLYNSALNIYD